MQAGPTRPSRRHLRAGLPPRATGWAGRVLRPAQVAVAEPRRELTVGSEQEGRVSAVSGRDVEKDYYAALGVPRTPRGGHQEGVPQARHASCTPTRTPATARPRSGSRPSPRPTTCCPTTPSAGEYDEQRSLFGGAVAGAGGGVLLRRQRPVRAGRCGRSGTSSAACSARAGGAVRAARPRRGADVEAGVTLSFVDALRGLHGAAAADDVGRVRRPAAAAAPPRAPAPRACGVCGGQGMVSRNQGGFAFAEPCTACRGSGKVVETPCPACRGAGATSSERRPERPHPGRDRGRPAGAARGARLARRARRPRRRPAASPSP